MRILVVEDDPQLGPLIKRGLEAHHYAVDTIADGNDALAMGRSVQYDVILLDILLPGMNGIEVCRALRQSQVTTPILMLTAQGDIENRVRGLDSGADDYVTKPFDFRELEARIRALLRREGTAKTPILQFMNVTLDATLHEVRRGDRLITLSSKEYALLEFLMRNPRQVLSRVTIAEHVWDYDAETYSNVIDVYIRYLRRKLCEDGEPDIIHTIRGSGYQLKEPVA